MSALLRVRDLRVRYPVPGSLLDRRRRSHVDVVHGVSLDVVLSEGGEGERGYR